MAKNTTKVPQTRIPKMTAGAAGGLGRIEKSNLASGKGSGKIRS